MTVTAPALGELRAELAGYTVPAIENLLGPLASAALHREQALPARRVLASSRDHLAVLVRCLTLGEPVPEEELRSALPTGTDTLTELGVLTREGDQVRALHELRPYDADGRTWWVISDLGELATGRPLARDHVLGIGGASSTLLSWTPRRQVTRALDVGTGCGVQALQLATHADQVTATDISTPALRLARLNAALNGVELDLRKGSFLEPVAGDQYDLVVANPPFVITPRRQDVPLFEYRDGGAEGDAVVAGLVRALPEVLAPGGIAQLLGNWELRADQDWREKVTGWLEGTGLDALVVQREVQDPAEYAETWIRDGGTRPGSAEFTALYEAWLDDFAGREIELIGFGIITVRRPAADRAPVTRLVEQLGPVGAPMGPEVLATLDAMNLIATSTGAELLDTRWRVAGDVTEERFARPGAADPSVIRLRRGDGLRPVRQIDTAESALVSVCDGELTAAQAATAIGVLLEEADLPARLLPTLRELVAEGFLEPVTR